MSLEQSAERSAPSVPETLDELLSPTWLTAALAPRFPGIRVTGVRPGPVVSRVATNASFHIECEGGVPEGLSPTLWGKGYFSEVGRQFRHTGRFEVSFYRHLAARSGVRTLTSVYADVDHETGHSAVITEDVLHQGAVFLDAASEYTPDLAAESLAQLAALHASGWGDPTVGTAEWLAPRLVSYTGHRGVREIRQNFESTVGAGVPVEVRNADRLFAAYEDVITGTADAEPWTVVHGDTHVGNLYLDGAGQPAFVDWQLVQRGPWYLDVGYHIASVLTVEDRRRTEKDLLRHYLDRLAAAGVDAPKWDEAWDGLRHGIVHGFYLWGITLKVDPAITATLLERLGTAAADHEVFAATPR
ncbi:phosphotransferase family protein [Yinghuangia sp. YIM S09857]|uniref:phosphotransferase family protein n=1 Tax=Yinghuangia sp. YIM S09857 TaxID=3436929 RepID=UPI003F531F10